MSMKNYVKRMLMQDVYVKLAEAEDEIRAGKTVDACTALNVLKAKTDYIDSQKQNKNKQMFEKDCNSDESVLK